MTQHRRCVQILGSGACPYRGYECAAKVFSIQVWKGPQTVWCGPVYSITFQTIKLQRCHERACNRAVAEAPRLDNEVRSGQA